MSDGDRFERAVTIAKIAAGEIEAIDPIEKSKQAERFRYICSLTDMVERAGSMATLHDGKTSLKIISAKEIVCATFNPSASTYTLEDIRAILIDERPDEKSKAISDILEATLAGQISPSFSPCPNKEKAGL